MTDLDPDDDVYAEDVFALDKDPVPGLGELPDCDDDSEDCLVVEPEGVGE